MFKHAYTDRENFKIIGPDGRVYTPDNALYRDFIKKNKPVKISGDRFVSIINGEVVINPDRETVLARELRRSVLESKVYQEIQIINREAAVERLLDRREITPVEADELLGNVVQNKR